MKKFLKRCLYVFLSGLVVIAITAIVWSMWPIKSGKGSADPTVVFENQRNANTKRYKESYFRHKGLDLHYIEVGNPDAQTVLFVHGFPSYWYSFIRQIDALSADYRVIAIDGLGAGRSDAPKDVAPYKLEAMTEHILSLLKHLGSDKVHLVGHDWGSALVFSIAQTHPDLVKSVTGVSAPPQNTMLELLLTNSVQQEKSQYVEKLKGANALLLAAFRAPHRVYQNAYLPLVDAGKLTPEEGHLFRQATEKSKRINSHINWYRANIPKIEDIGDEDFWPARNSPLNIPALVIWGNDDRVFVDEFIDMMEQSTKDLRVVKLDGVGHWPHVEESALVTSEIRRLIDWVETKQ